jgi:hypothetical protein
MDIKLHEFLIFAVDGKRLSVSNLGLFITGEISGTFWTEGWVDLMAYRNARKKRKYLTSADNRTLIALTSGQ